MSAITLYRIARWFYLHQIILIPRLLYVANYLIFNCSIPSSTDIGVGTRLGYGGMGIVIHSSSKIGMNCLISQQVTIGGRSHIKNVPVIGNNVYIGAGAKILGNITIGDGSVIGANAVVVHDVPHKCVVAGVPAKVIKDGIDFHDYL